jgi:hypothetical protein
MSLGAFLDICGICTKRVSAIAVNLTDIAGTFIKYGKI